jgi:hypothetical protein
MAQHIGERPQCASVEPRAQPSKHNQLPFHASHDFALDAIPTSERPEGRLAVNVRLALAIRARVCERPPR